jgi:hypothetical protein
LEQFIIDEGAWVDLEMTPAVYLTMDALPIADQLTPLATSYTATGVTADVTRGVAFRNNQFVETLSAPIFGKSFTLAFWLYCKSLSATSPQYPLVR